MGMTRVGWIRIAVLTIAIGLLELCCRVGFIDRRVLIPPSEMADALVQLLISGQFNDQIVRTFAIVIVAVLISVVLGFALGALIHALPRVRHVDRIPRVLTKVARVHHMGTIATALLLKLPAAAPHLFTGVKLAVSYAFIGVIASEFILAPSGLGRVISDAYSDFNNRRMYALMLLLIIVATVVNMLLHVFDQRWAERRGIGKS